VISSGRPGLLLVAHGTRDGAGLLASGRLAASVVCELSGVAVRLAFVDVRRPTVADVLPGLLARAGEVVVVPAFLASGYHVRTDLPAQLDALGLRDRVVVTPALGADPLLVAAARDRLRAAGRRRGDAVVLAAAGSSDPAARAEVRRAARMLGRELDTSVRVGFLAGPGPRLDDVVAEAGAAGRRVAVASWLLAPGLFQRRLPDSGAAVCAPPLAGHRGVRDTVLARYRDACRIAARWPDRPSAPARRGAGRVQLRADSAHPAVAACSATT
jgi:sirohydrochlorin ferrochelatase